MSILKLTRYRYDLCYDMSNDRANNSQLFKGDFIFFKSQEPDLTMITHLLNPMNRSVEIEYWTMKRAKPPGELVIDVHCWIGHLMSWNNL